MANRLDNADSNNVPPVAGTLLDYIQQQWSRLLARESLSVRLQLAAYSSGLHCELFIGDEFLRADRRYLDVVVKATDARARLLLPTVLVFEVRESRKYGGEKLAQLVQHELNGLALDTPVLAEQGLATSETGLAELMVQAKARLARDGCCGSPRASLMDVY